MHRNNCFPDLLWISICYLVYRYISSREHLNTEIRITYVLSKKGSRKSNCLCLSLRRQYCKTSAAGLLLLLLLLLLLPNSRPERYPSGCAVGHQLISRISQGVLKNTINCCLPPLFSCAARVQKHWKGGRKRSLGMYYCARENRRWWFQLSQSSQGQRNILKVNSAFYL